VGVLRAREADRLSVGRVGTDAVSDRLLQIWVGHARSNSAGDGGECSASGLLGTVSAGWCRGLVGVRSGRVGSQERPSERQEQEQEQ
jgi:hypothetical protein